MLKKLKLEIRNQYSHFLTNTIHFLGKQKIEFDKKKNENKIHLEDLTPFLSDEDEKNNSISETYLESLKWGILKDEIKNIAISGSFGTGKSTIINLFKKKYPEFKTIDINLGKFEEKNKQTEVDIETSIVQQILYFEKKGRLKESRFERITYDKYIFTKLIGFIFWLYSFTYLFFEKIYNKIYLIETKENYFQNIFMKIVFIVGTFLILKKIFKQIANLKINKLSFSDAEFVSKDKNDISIINKHIDELLYFFEKTKTQIVFIEDIDRFEDAVDVFIKLRELNILINNSKDITEKVKFVYAVKDELFSKNNEKTKFFDLIIPIIPVIDYSNSNTQFIKKLKKDFIDKEILSEDIIMNVSPYINDMRTLINIINEFKIYYKIKTSKTSFDAEKLFGLIVLKNIYPNEFKNLQNRKGKVFAIFENKNELNSESINILKEKIKLHKLKIGELNYEHLNEISELRKIYIYHLLCSKSATQYEINGKTVRKEDLILEDNFESFLSTNNIRLLIQYSWINYKFDDLEKEVDDYLTYHERKKIIELNKNNEINNLHKNIRDSQEEIEDIKNTTLFQLLGHLESNTIEDYLNKFLENENDKKDYSLLKVLITNNYINEYYTEYISLFYPESLSENDYIIKMKIIEDKNEKFNDKIDNPEKLISELAINNFTKKSILNFQIFDSLIKISNSKFLSNKKRNNFEIKLNEIIKRISNYDDTTVEFYNEYFNHLENNHQMLYLFINEISVWENFWDFIFIKQQFTTKTKKLVFDFLFISSNIERLKSLNKTKKINAFLNNYEDFLYRINEKIDNKELINKLKNLGIKFNKIKYNKDIFQLIFEVYENNLYKINISNVILFLEVLNFKKINFNLRKSNYSFLQESDCHFLKTNVENNINEYVEQVLLKLENNTEEKEENVIKLLNNENIKDENKEILVEKLKFKINNITEIENTNLWKDLFFQNKITANWSNLLKQYLNNEEDKFDYNFKDFLDIHENHLLLSKTKISDELKIELDANLEDDNDRNDYVFDYNTIKSFTIDLINSNIENKSFEYISKSLTQKINVNEIERPERIDILIKNDLIEFDQENIIALESDNKRNFIEKNAVTFYENYFEYELDIDSWSEIFKSNLNANYKAPIFEHISEQEIYNEEDLDFIRTILFNFIKGKFYSYSKYFIETTLKSNLNSNEKIIFLNFILSDETSENYLKNYIELLGQPFSKIIKKEEFELNYNNEYEKFFKFLQKRKLLKLNCSKKQNFIKISYEKGQ